MKYCLVVMCLAFVLVACDDNKPPTTAPSDPITTQPSTSDNQTAISPKDFVWLTVDQLETQVRHLRSIGIVSKDKGKVIRMTELLTDTAQDVDRDAKERN